MRLKPWTKMPSTWIRNGTMKSNFSWAKQGSAGIAALQLWVVLVTQSEVVEDEDGYRILHSSLTYEALMYSTGLSRKLIAAGLRALQDAGVVEIEREGRNSSYTIRGIENGHYCMLPVRAIYTSSKDGVRIPAFQNFQKRSKCELNALKLYLYYAAGRDNRKPFTMTAFEKLSEYTGVAEKDIPKANAFLLTVGLLANINKEATEATGFKEANKYYLAGHPDLFIGEPKTG